MDKTGIYCFIDKSKDQVVYVGQAKKLYCRLGTHYMSDGTIHGSAIDNVLFEDFDRYEWRILEECNVEELNQKEMYWAKYYNVFDVGYNRKGISCIEQIDIETNKVINTFSTYEEAAKAVNGYRSGICNCVHGRAKTAYGYKWRNNGIIASGKYATTDSSTRGKARAINSYDAKGEYIKTYNSITEAAKELGVNPSAIGHVLKGRAKTCRGLSFHYVDEVQFWE